MAIERYTDEQLDKLYQLWGLKRDTSASMTLQIYRLDARKEDVIASRFVWERLTLDERNVLYRALTPNSGAMSGIYQEDLRKKTQLPEEQFQTALSRLVEYKLLRVSEETTRSVYNKNDTPGSIRKLVWTNGYTVSDVLYNTGREMFMPGKERTNKELGELLSQLSDDELYRLISLYHINVSGYYSHADLRYGVASGIKNAGNLLDLLPLLDASARSIVLWLRDTGRKATMQAVREKLHMDDVQLIDLLHRLAAFSLAFDTFSDGVHVLFIPQDVYVGLSEREQKEARKKPGKGTLLQVEQEPAMVRSGEPISVYDIATLIGAVYQQRIELNQTGKLPKRITSKLRPMLRGQARNDYIGEDQYLDLLVNALEELRILTLTEPKVANEKPAIVPGESLPLWSTMTLAQQTTMLVNYWIQTGNWRDVYGVHYKPVYAYTWSGESGRKALLQHLMTCEPNRWYTIESLIDLLWEKDAFAFRPQRAFPAKAKVHEIRALWNRCEAEVYIGLLASTLNEFGLVSVGYSQDASHSETAGTGNSGEQAINPDMFLVTDLGAQLFASAQTEQLEAAQVPVKGNVSEDTTQELQETQEVQENVERSLVVQPNFEVLFLQPDIPTLYSLLPFAQVKQLGLVSRLTLTKVSVLHGLMAGEKTEHLFGILRERSQRELPQNVEYTLNDWTKDYRDINVTQVLLFELSHEDLLARLKPHLKDLLLRQITPTLIAVKSTTNVQTLRKVLEKEGIVLNVHGDIYTMVESPHRDYFTYDRYQ